MNFKQEKLKEIHTWSFYNPTPKPKTPEGPCKQLSHSHISRDGGSPLDPLQDETVNQEFLSLKMKEKAPLLGQECGALGKCLLSSDTHKACLDHLMPEIVPQASNK